MIRARLFAIMLGAAGVFLLGVSGQGQENLGLAGRGDSLRLALLRTPEVQKELKLKADQLQKIGRIGEEAKQAKKQAESATKDKAKGKTKAVDPIAKEQERLAREAMDGVLSEVMQGIDEQINAVLDSRQRNRLTQIVLRVQGPSAFRTPELIDALGLGPDQVEAIGEVLDGVKGEQDQYKERQKRSSELAKASGDFELEKVRKDQEKARTRAYAFKLSKQVMPEIGRILTRRQRDQYNRMLGESFDLAKLTGRDGQPLIDDSADLEGWLLRQPAVQEELKLNAEQKGQLARGLTPAKVLDSDQVARLRQLVIQGEGPAALTRPDVARALRLDDEQAEQIRAVFEGLLGANQQLRESLKNDNEDFHPGDPAQEATRKEQEKARLRAGAADLRDGTMQRINAILTRKQKETVARLYGKPFDFSKIRNQPPTP
jgi:hypothetical protein